MAPTKLRTFKTRLQLTAAKKDGRIDGYFGRMAKGRPVVEKAGKAVAVAAIKGSRPMNMSTKEVIKAGKKGSNAYYVNWNLPENFNALKASVISHVKAKEAKELGNDDMTGILPATTVFIPRTTLQWHVDRFVAVAKEKNLPLERLYRDDIFPKSRGGGKGLLDENEIELLAQTFIYRDEANLGMSRNEAISLVMEMAQTTDRGAAENHFDFSTWSPAMWLRMLGVW